MPPSSVASPVDPFALFETAPDPVAVFAPDGALERANAAFRGAFRFAVTPHRPAWGRVTPPAFTGEERRFEAACPDGRLFEWAERRLPDGRRLALARDVSARADAAREVARAKTTLFATLTHELRTPLNGVLGMARLLETSRLDPAQAEWVAAVRRSGEHLLDLITEILEYSRLEAGRVALEEMAFSPEEAAQSVAELLSPKAQAKGLEIVVAPGGPIPALVRGDEGRLRQILFNLAGNAVKFTQSGGVVIEITALKDAALRFGVRDTGPGVPADKQELIFEEFQQADPETARRFGGAGLGLAIVRRLAEAMGGRVGLKSRAGAGAFFWAELPFAAAPGGARPAQIDGAVVAIEAPEPLSGAIARMIESLGGRLAGAKRAADLSLIDHRHLTDDSDLARRLRRGPPILALVPQEDRAAVERLRRAGVAGYLLKPLRRSSLAEQINRVVRGVRSDPPQRPWQRDGKTHGLGVAVLVADDNPINALLARTLLERHGCVVEAVSDGAQAVEAARARPFDIVFLDVRMPVLDGFGAARRIRSGGGPCADAPIYALTANASDADRAAALEAGMTGFITKPLDPDRLADALERLRARPNSATVAR